MLELLVMMYADDTVIFANDESGMCNSLKAMEKYCDKWKLDINCKKTKLTVFSKKKFIRNYNFQFKGQNIEIVDAYKYLDIVMNFNGNFKT